MDVIFSKLTRRYEANTSGISQRCDFKMESDDNSFNWRVICSGLLQNYSKHESSSVYRLKRVDIDNI